MPEISFQIDAKTLKKVENAAKAQHTTISLWVSELINERLKSTYPDGFEALFGSITDASFVEPIERKKAK